MLDQDFIEEFEKDEEDYGDFYNEKVDQIKIYYLYVNDNNELYNVKCENETLDNGYLKKERMLYLIQNNNFHSVNRHKLVSILKFNINLDHTEIKSFVNKVGGDDDEGGEGVGDEGDDNFLTSLKLLDSIYFDDTIGMFMDLNCIFFIFTSISQKLNTTKRINIKTKSTKTRRKNKGVKPL